MIESDGCMYEIINVENIIPPKTTLSPLSHTHLEYKYIR